MMLSGRFESLNNILFNLIIVGCLGILSACGREYCTTNPDRSREYLNVGFYTTTLVDGEEQDTTVRLRFRSIHAPGRENLAANVDTLSGIRLRLPTAEDTATFYFERVNFDNSVESDTLQLLTGRKLVLRSQACGFEVRYDTVNILQHTFESLAVEKAAIDSTNAINLKIYYF